MGFRWRWLGKGRLHVAGAFAVTGVVTVAVMLTTFHGASGLTEW